MDNLGRMGELIDRDRLLDYLYEWKGRLGSSVQEEAVDVMLTVMIDKIRQQPVAYDLSGVLIKLENMCDGFQKTIEECYINNTNENALSGCVAKTSIKRAIKIVKAGIKV